jgi:hypothetical protein
MPFSLSHQSTFTFMGGTYDVTSVSVQGPTPEVVDMTPHNAPASQRILVPTGAYTDTGSIDVEALGFADPKNLTGLQGEAVFTTPLGSVTRIVICESASAEGRVGDVLRLRFTLKPTDYTG